MSDDLEQELFGSDSDDQEIQQRAPSLERGTAVAAPELDEDESEFQDKPAPAQPAALMRDDEEADEDMADAASDGEEPDAVKPQGPPLNITVAAFTPLESGSLSVVKLPNIVNINPEPWSRDTFDPSTELQTDQNGDTRPRLGNTIRWREGTSPSGSPQRQSNARFVQWSDGSWQLLVGDEVLDVKESDIRMDHSFLYARQQGILQAVAQLRRRWALQPASLKSRLHMQLASAMDKQHVKHSRVKHTATVIDPGREKEKRAQERERTIRSKDALTRRQATVKRVKTALASIVQDREMRKYTIASPGFRQARAQGVTATYLEEGDEDEYEDEGLTPSERARSSLIRPQTDAAAESEAAKRLASAKRNVPTQARQPASKRAKAAASSDEELSDQDMDHEAPASDPEQAPKLKARRAVVLSDDESD